MLETGMNRSPFRKIAGKHPPLASAFQQIEHGAEHLVQIDLSRTGFAPGAFKQGTDDFKLLAGNVARIFLSHVPSMTNLKDYEQVLRDFFESLPEDQPAHGRNGTPVNGESQAHFFPADDPRMLAVKNVVWYRYPARVSPMRVKILRSSQLLFLPK